MTRSRSTTSAGPASPRAMMRALTGLTAAQHTLLTEVSSHATPLTIAELADRMGLHQNSVRESMAALVEQGLVARKRQPTLGRGRPSWAYESIAPTQTAALSREFADMTTAVADHLSSSVPDPRAAAHDIGARWGRRMLDTLPAADTAPTTAEDRSRPEVHASTIRLFMSSLGYQALADDEAARLTLYQCPLRAEGSVPSPLVCEMHRGMLDEVLGALSDGTVGASLTPFAGPDYCTVELATLADEPEADEPGEPVSP